MIDRQNRDGIAPELAEEKRFFELNSFNKTALPEKWNNPDKWRELSDIPEDKSVGFAVSGSGSTLALIDYDHVLDSNGRMFPKAWQIYKKIEDLGGTYTELSISESGLHQIIDLGEYADNFSPESNQLHQKILWMDYDRYKNLPECEQKKVPKIELFFDIGGRYCLLTGHKFRKSRRVARDRAAANIWYAVLAEREKCLEQYASSQTESVSDSAKFRYDQATIDRAVSAMDFISADDYETWIRIGQACYNSGISFDVWDEWSQFSDKRSGVICDKYKNADQVYKWKSFGRTKSKWNIGTIFIMAKESGWTSADTLEPDDLTDLGQAQILAREYGDHIRYSPQTGFLVYDSKVWREDDLGAQALSQELTDRQLQEAKKRIQEARKNLDNSLETDDKDAIADAKSKLKAEERYRKYVLDRRASTKISATLRELQPKVAIDIALLDADGFLLNTPAGTVDLKTGKLRPHNPLDYCTKITSLAPSEEGSDIFASFLEQITCGDQDLQRYLQETIGLSAIGAVKTEQLIIAIGFGGNGKSTFFNLCSKALGDYSGMLSSEVLTTGCRKNKSPEYAELRGKRLVIAAELEEGQRLDTAVVKKLCSTDPVQCEPKYRQPFSFIPSHHVVLYTNFLPKVGTQDNGTWDRLVTVPFNARFRGQVGEIKDFATELYNKCGGAVLAWIIEGAQRVIENRFFIKQPQCVQDAVEEYRSANDWLSAFVEEKCYCDPTYTVGASELYSAYREYCSASGEYVRHNSEFAQSLEKAGFEGKRTKTGKVYRGLRLKSLAERKHDAIQAYKEA